MWRDTERWLNFVLLDDCRVEDQNERDERRWPKSLWDPRTSEYFVSGSMYQSWYSSYNFHSGKQESRYQVFSTQMCYSYPWFLISAHIDHIIPIIIPQFLFLVHKSAIIAEHITELSLTIIPCHDYDLTLSTAHTEYSINRTLSVFPSFSWWPHDHSM